MRRIGLAVLLLIQAFPLHGQQKDGAPTSPIQDNSFLIEEAYNQEPGIVQHISSFQRTRPGGAWLTTFTQEWPAPGTAHQLSYGVTYLRLAPAAGDGRGLGDLGLNYRYQLVGNADAPVAIAPRVTVLLPSGNEREGLGSGSVGYQINFPVSTVLSERLVAHWNAGATWTPRARNALGQRADTAAVSLGQSTIFHLLTAFDLMLEMFWTRTQSVAAPGRTESDRTFLISPGLRFAWNAPHGLQIVPGIGVPFGVGPSRGQRSVLLYLSFEHAFQEIKRLR